MHVVGRGLSIMEYEVLLARSADQAIEQLNAITPDLILLDVQMPGTNGLEACQMIKADPRWADIPVIFLSATDDKNFIVQALESGGVDYVTKPFYMAELISRVRTQLALKRSSDQLRILAEDKDEILGILAHDMKNSLAGMKLSAGLMQARVAELPPRCVPLVENIVSAADRMLSFMEEFLANQRAEHLTIKKQPVNLSEVVRMLIAKQLPAANAKNIALNFTVPKAPAKVLVDAEGLTQALENLVSNAIKFSPAGSEVEVVVDRPMAGMVKCHVIDSGPGFSADDRARMFRRYGRLSAQPTGNEPSTGLGLSIVKKLVTSMGGSITLAERDKPGAEFIVALPVADPPVADES